MTLKHALLLPVVGALTLVCAGMSAVARGGAADDATSKIQPQPPAAGTATAPQTENQYRFLQPCGYTGSDVIRFGYWGTSTSGSPVKVGEYQDLGASPFYDLDGIHSDGRRTLNYTITGTDAESNAANANYYQNGVQVNANYIRFPHQLRHENLGEFPNYTDPTSTQQFRRQDVNAGEDYAIRVQELKANVKWQISDTLKARVDVWSLKKEGERQVNAGQECYAHRNGVTPDTFGGTKNCHVLSQMQHIDWETTEVKPVIELKLGKFVVEYSRPMRVFSTADQGVYRFYDNGGSGASEFGAARYMEYGVVPSSTTQTDQLKISADLNDDNKLYTFMFVGNTHKESDIASPISLTPPPFAQSPSDERIENRQFSGADLRWTNTSVKNVSITTYGRTTAENNEAAAFLIPGEETRDGKVGGTSAPVEDAPTGITPIDYQRTQFGTKAVWRPFGRGFGLGGFAINGGYEHSIIHRVGLEVDTGSDDPPFQGTIIEENTTSNMFSIGPSMRWSPQLDTYLRYKYCHTQDPLFATNSHGDSNYTAVALNSALPTDSNEIEIGGTLMPSDRFLLTGWFGVDIQSQHFGEAIVQNEPGKTTVTNLNVPMGNSSQSFPFGVNGSYRATDKLTFNGGAAYYTNFITQDVAFGAGADHTLSGSATPYGLLINQWGYSGRAAVFTLGTTYDLTCKLRLIGMVEYVKGLEYAYQIAGDPRFPSTDAALSGVPQYLRQDVISTRFSGGVDYQFSRRVAAYFRYVLYDYNDMADQAQLAASTQPVTGLPLSGTSNMFLGGMSAQY